MYCSNCGRKISASSQFCPYCGTPIKSNSTNSKQQTFRRRSSHNVSRNSARPKRSFLVSQQHHKKLIWAILAIVIIIAVGFGYYQYKQSPASANLATTMPEHKWKIQNFMWTGHDVTSHFHKHYIRAGTDKYGIHASYGKNYFTLYDSGTTMKYNLKKIEEKDYYFNVTYFSVTNNGDGNMKFSGNTIRSNNGKVKIVLHGKRLIMIVGSIHKRLPLDNDMAKFARDLLLHKQVKIVKE